MPLRLRHVVLFLAWAVPTAAPARDYRQDLTLDALHGTAIPQEAPRGFTVRWRLGHNGPFEEAHHLNGHFDRVGETAKLLDREGDPLERCCAIRELARYKNVRTVRALISALLDINLYVRQEAARALGDFGDPRAIRPLITMLSYSDPVRAAIAARALEKITGVHNLGSSLEAWELWYDAYKRFPHGVATPLGGPGNAPSRAAAEDLLPPEVAAPAASKPRPPGKSAAASKSAASGGLPGAAAKPAPKPKAKAKAPKS